METALLSMAQQFSGLPMEALIGGPLNAAANANAAMAITQTKFMLDTCFIKTEVEAKPEVAGVAPDPTANPPVAGKPTIPAIPKHNEYSPIMIVMSLTRPVITPGTPGSPAVQADPATNTPARAAVDAKPAIIQNVTSQFNLPMLTVVPLNSLAVQSVDINFEMEVKSSFSQEESKSSEQSRKAEGSFEAKVGWGPFSVTVKGSASYDSKDTSSQNSHYQKSNSAKYTVAVHAGQQEMPKGVNTIIEAFTRAIDPITLSVS